LTEIYLCHACSCQQILRTETAGQETLSALRHPNILLFMGACTDASPAGGGGLCIVTE
jgi:hypothetical protein